MNAGIFNPYTIRHIRSMLRLHKLTITTNPLWYFYNPLKMNIKIKPQLWIKPKIQKYKLKNQVSKSQHIRIFAFQCLQNVLFIFLLIYSNLFWEFNFYPITFRLLSQANKGKNL